MLTGLKMKKRKLGHTGIEISEIAFGTVELGMPYGIGIEHESQMLPEAEAIGLLQTAFENGINFFDTARLYGKSEMLLGKAFKKKRKQVVIASKCAHLRQTDKTIPRDNTLADMLERSLADSLHALQTDYIDLFMLHDGDKEILQHPVIKQQFEKFKKEGLIRAAGVSTYTPAETKAAMESGNWDVVQLPFNMMDQRQSALFSKLHQKGIGIIVRSVLLKGLLSGSKGNLHPALSKVEKHIAAYSKLVNTTGFTLPQLATKFALSFPEVTSVLIGIDKQEYLKAALHTVDGNYLSTRLLNELKQQAFPDPDFLNLHQWNVNGWLK